MDRVLSHPMGIQWAGWRSDTLTLQRAGWNIAVEYEAYRNEYRLLMRNQAMRLMAMTDRLHIESAIARNWDMRDMPVFTVRHCAPSIQVSHEAEINFEARFQPIDATPAYVTSKITRMEDLNVFNVVSQTEQVLMDKADMTVIEHLEAIKALQSSKQRELRERMLRAPAQPERSTPRLHLVAQLVHLEEAA